MTSTINLPLLFFLVNKIPPAATFMPLEKQRCHSLNILVVIAFFLWLTSLLLCEVFSRYGVCIKPVRNSCGAKMLSLRKQK